MGTLRWLVVAMSVLALLIGWAVMVVGGVALAVYVVAQGTWVAARYLGAGQALYRAMWHLKRQKASEVPGAGPHDDGEPHPATEYIRRFLGSVSSPSPEALHYASHDGAVLERVAKAIHDSSWRARTWFTEYAELAEIERNDYRRAALAALVGDPSLRDRQRRNPL